MLLWIYCKWLLERLLFVKFSIKLTFLGDMPRFICFEELQAYISPNETIFEREKGKEIYTKFYHECVPVLFYVMFHPTYGQITEPWKLVKICHIFMLQGLIQLVVSEQIHELFS